MTNKNTKCWYVYVIECRNGRLYTGITVNLAERFKKHASGKGAMFTKLNPPSRMIAAKACKDRSVASKLEYAIKSLTPEQKRSTVATWPLCADLPKL